MILSKMDEIYPLAIPNQILKISMHIPYLVKIHWYLLVIIHETKIRTDWQMYDRQMDRWMDKQTDTQTPTWNHNNPLLSCDGV